ncbi:hypothetical protein GCM10017600_61270 [Streptosporangium carneum]|uniref:Uncharacterized protein n=1 Tax=Streptosporangium carneum TaxID=47481 RepID=A0A9W6MG34_9ACTN|nr:hypothetical protein GCM10017600_61270 [Streptosporangium carneum]
MATIAERVSAGRRAPVNLDGMDVPCVSSVAQSRPAATGRGGAEDGAKGEDCTGRDPDVEVR